MSVVTETQQPNRLYRLRLERGISLVDRCFDTLFDQAPVMMHSIDELCRLLRVNRVWLETLGYDEHEVLGQRYVDFLTERSRACAVIDTLPLFWRTGSARNVGYEMIRKDGRVINVLVDANLDTDVTGIRQAITAVRTDHDLMLWEHSSAMLAGLTSLVRIKRSINTVLTLENTDGVSELPDPDSALPGRDMMLDLSVVVGEVSKTLQSLGSALADSARDADRQEQNLLELSEAVTTCCGKLPWLAATKPAAVEKTGPRQNEVRDPTT